MALRAKKEEIAELTTLDPVRLDSKNVKSAIDRADVVLALVEHLGEVYSAAQVRTGGKRPVHRPWNVVMLRCMEIETVLTFGVLLLSPISSVVGLFLSFSQAVPEEQRAPRLHSTASSSLGGRRPEEQDVAAAASLLVDDLLSDEIGLAYPL
eukprot:COSAG05_NODE_150_length_16171_cov_64.740356_6_plen_152_part_00